MTKQSKITAAHDMPVIEYLALADLTLSDLNPRKEVSEASRFCRKVGTSVTKLTFSLRLRC